MLTVLKDTYKTYVKKFPYLVLFIIPLLVYSAGDDALKHFFANSDFMTVWGVLSIVFSALVYTATQIFIYRYLMNVHLGKAMGFLKVWAKFFVVHLVLSNLIMLPVLGFMFGAVYFEAGSYAFPLALVVNMFLGFWLMARVNVVLPMMVANEDIAPKAVWEFGQDSYKAWLLPVAFVYLPYVLAFYLIHCAWVKVIVVGLLSVLVTVFNVVYYQSKKAKPAKTAKVSRATKKKAE